MDKFKCECGSFYRKNDKSRHERTIKHKKFSENKIGIASNQIYESYSNSSDVISSEKRSIENNEHNENDNFLDELNADKYQSTAFDNSRPKNE